MVQNFYNISAVGWFNKQRLKYSPGYFTQFALAPILLKASFIAGPAISELSALNVLGQFTQLYLKFTTAFQIAFKNQIF